MIEEVAEEGAFFRLSQVCGPALSHENVQNGLLLWIVSTAFALIFFIGRYCRDYLQQIADQAFDIVDVDKSGTIDAKEVEVAVLHVYLQVSINVVRVAPPGREVIQAYLDHTDTNRDGTLDRIEFKKFMQVLGTTV